MDVPTLRQFFMWCAILNGSLLIVAFLICTLAGNWVYRVQSRWFPVPRETFNVAVYAFLAVFKSLLLVFSLVPYLALVILS